MRHQSYFQQTERYRFARSLLVVGLDTNYLLEGLQMLVYLRSRRVVIESAYAAGFEIDLADSVRRQQMLPYREGHMLSECARYVLAEEEGSSEMRESTDVSRWS